MSDAVSQRIARDDFQATSDPGLIESADRADANLLSYGELYRLWERQQWRTQDIDFSQDRIDWHERIPDEERFQRMYGLSSFFIGEQRVAEELGPMMRACPDEEMRIFVATQLADEARHTVFFARFFKEVLEIDKTRLEDTLENIQQYMNKHLQYILIDSLSDVAERIRQEPTNLAHLIEGITLYHVIVEGTMALAGQRGILEFYRQNNLFPAFRGGFTAVARDESRHVVFGVKFLREMIQRDAANARVVKAAIDKYAQVAFTALTPADENIPDILAMQQDPWVSPRYALDSLRKKIKVIGLSMDLPVVPPPPLF